MTEKQQQITFTKGITNQPSDAICSDGELSNCVGLTAEYGELKPIQMPVVISGTPQNSNILCVHDGRYLYQDGQYIKYYPYTGQTNTVASFSGTFKDIATIGNTVIVSTSTEMRYALWQGDRYTPLGSKIPEPEVRFRMGVNESEIYGREFDGLGYDTPDVPESERAQWNDTVVGIFSEAVNVLHRKKMFMQPFVLMVALELYDGSYTLHSNPFIMIPWLNANVIALSKYLGSGDDTCVMYLMGSHLYYHLETDYSDWRDIVRNVSVFISREVNMFKADASWIKAETSDVHSDLTWYNPHKNNDSAVGGFMFDYNTIRTWKWFATKASPRITRFETCFIIRESRDRSEIQHELANESVFYKLCDINKNSNFENMASLFGEAILENIETQEQLPNADYHTHDITHGNYLYPYNGRLHMADVKRELFNGFNHFSYWNNNTYRSYTIDVYIKINTGETKIVRQTADTTAEAIGQTYLFYPDARATKVRIWVGSDYFERTLTEHPGLNGSYWFSMPALSSSVIEAAMYDTNDTFSMGPTSSSVIQPQHPAADIYAPNPTYTGSETKGSVTPVVEYIPDTIMVSEVDNPFLFLAKGYVKVNAPVVGMAAVTMALSEYQHGHQPLVVFTEKGIWSLSLNAEGYYTSVQAVSREVCNNASSITQVDHGIYFVSQKGLMYLNTAGVKCVSDQMRGTEFDEFIDDCMIAYDYRDSLLHIYPKPNNAQGFGDTYVYNMKTGTFSTVQGAFTNVVNNYPDTLVQNSSYYAYSFMQRPDEQSDGSYSGGTFIFNTYNARIETRPMKLENALALKSILQVRHIHTIKLSQTTTLTFKVYASNNLDRDQNTWVQLTSLRGRPWKYYKFVYEFTGLKATDRFAGTMLITQERRTDKLR